MLTSCLVLSCPCLVLLLRITRLQASAAISERPIEQQHLHLHLCAVEWNGNHLRLVSCTEISPDPCYFALRCVLLYPLWTLQTRVCLISHLRRIQRRPSS
ncbi:hypothetical protein B0H14DRAFT_2723106 [Mycena olivaceomarginata]|nr:hypothetical protein B0H14DRAFT_2723106 [Mycena olivaceomarginata]